MAGRRSPLGTEDPTGESTALVSDVDPNQVASPVGTVAKHTRPSNSLRVTRTSGSQLAPSGSLPTTCRDTAVPNVLLTDYVLREQLHTTRGGREYQTERKPLSGNSLRGSEGSRSIPSRLS